MVTNDHLASNFISICNLGTAKEVMTEDMIEDSATELAFNLYLSLAMRDEQVGFNVILGCPGR